MIHTKTAKKIHNLSTHGIRYMMPIYIILLVNCEYKFKKYTTIIICFT